MPPLARADARRCHANAGARRGAGGNGVGHCIVFAASAGEEAAPGALDGDACLDAVSGEEVTAKEFRTWAAINPAAMTVTELERFDTEVKN